MLLKCFPELFAYGIGKGYFTVRFEILFQVESWCKKSQPF